LFAGELVEESGNVLQLVENSYYAFITQVALSVDTKHINGLKVNFFAECVPEKIKKRILIICFIIKNPPTVHSIEKIQPTTSPTFVFSVSASVRKKWGYERKLLDSRNGRSSSCFLFSFYYFTLKVQCAHFIGSRLKTTK
jgi:hypothetical protein